jgi:hypothetical protein
VGMGEGTHPFFKAEGINTCNTCNVNICYCCAIPINKEKCEMYCINCYIQEKSIPSEPFELTSHVSRSDMLRGLASLGSWVKDSNDIDNDAIEDMYDTMVLNKEAVFDENILNRVQYPKESTTYLTEEVSSVCEFAMKDGGRYIHSTKMTTQQKKDLTMLLTDLTTIPEVDAKENNKCYRVIPPIIKKFAQGARVRKKVIRLWNRSYRHSVDLKSIDIRSCSGQVMEYEGQIGLVLKHVIKASMKSGAYNTQVAFTRTDLVACSCTCQCGSFGIEKIVCTHIFPILFQIGQLMHHCLSEHILIELTNFFSGNRMIELKNDEEMIRSIHILIRSEQGYEPDKTQPIEELLLKYQVGTEKNKTKLLSLQPKDYSSNVNEYCRLEDLDRKSAYRKAYEVQTKTVSDNKENDEEDDVEPMTQETYTNICTTISAVMGIQHNSSNYECLQDLVGFKLCNHRARSQQIPTRIINEKKRKWKQLMNTANLSVR